MCIVMCIVTLQQLLAARTLRAQGWVFNMQASRPAGTNTCQLGVTYTLPCVSYGPTCKLARVATYERWCGLKSKPFLIWNAMMLMP